MASPERPGGAAGFELELGAVLPWLESLAPTLEHHVVEPALLRARLADLCRDADVPPMTTAEFDAATAGLDAEAWRRLALLVLTLAALPDAGILAALTRRRVAADALREGLMEHARGRSLLTLELLRKSPLRCEELARGWFARMGARVKDEPPEHSRRMLQRLDYGRLLAEAEQARSTAEERMEYLRKLQAEDDKKVAPRGKW